MSITVFALVLLGAALHASWNAVVKRGQDTLLTMILVTVSAALIAVLGLPFLPAPSPAAWPFIAGSTMLQIIYFVLVARAYQVADMSLAYPLMRGTAPLLVALASLVWIGETLSPGGWLGLGIICAGILGMAFSARSANTTGMAFALGNAVVIAAYTIIDGIGVRRSSVPAAYTLWVFLLSGFALAAWAITMRRRAIIGFGRQYWRLGLVGGVGSLGAYGLALWAMTMAPVALVATLRETSILFGIAISALLLRERVGKIRIACGCVIALGAAVLRYA